MEIVIKSDGGVSSASVISGHPLLKESCREKHKKVEI
jgi:hypothetical protein